MKYFHGYWHGGMKELDGCKRWQEVVVSFREGNSETRTAENLFDNCSDADIITVFSENIFIDSQAVHELISAMNSYNKKSKKNNIRYRFRVANDNEFMQLQNEHKEKNILIVFVRIDIYGGWNYQDKEYFSKNG